MQVKDLQAIAAPQGSGLRAETLNRASGLPVRSKVQKQSHPAATRLEMLDLAERLIGLPRVAAQVWPVVPQVWAVVPAAVVREVVAVAAEAAVAAAEAEVVAGGEATSRSGLTSSGLRTPSMVFAELTASIVMAAMPA